MNNSLSSSDFLLTIKQSKSLNLDGLSFKYKKSPQPLLGMAVSKKYGNAIKRNLFKRRCRNVFKLIVADKGINFTIIVFPLKKNLSYLNIKNAFISLHDKFSC